MITFINQFAIGFSMCIAAALSIAFVVHTYKNFIK